MLHLYLPLVALILVSLNLRPALTSIAPLIEVMVAETGLERSISAALAILTISLAIRVLADNSIVLMISAVGIGIGIAIVGTLMAAFIKQYFSEQLNQVIPFYTLSMTLGVALGMVLTLPLLSLFCDWRWTMAAWCIPTLIAWLIWQPLIPTKANTVRAVAPKLPFRSAKAWLLTVLFPLQSGVFYSLTTWLVARYEETGYSLIEASGFASVFMFAGLGCAFLAPILMRWVTRTHLLLMAVNLIVCLVLICVLLIPQQLPILVCAILGIALTSMFALAMSLPIDETETPLEAASLTSMMLTFGFCIGSLVPSLVGIARDYSGSYTFPFTGLVIASATMVVLSALFGSFTKK